MAHKTPWNWMIDKEFLNRRSYKVFVLTGFMGGYLDGQIRVIPPIEGISP